MLAICAWLAADLEARADAVPAVHEAPSRFDQTPPETNDNKLCNGTPRNLDSSLWDVHEIKELQVANTVSAKPDRIPATSKDLEKYQMPARPDARGCRTPNLVTAGAFIGYDEKNRPVPMGTMMRPGHNEVDYVISPKSKVYKRGGLAVLENGQIVICRPSDTQKSLDKRALTEACGKPYGSRVVQFMGGGVSLIHKAQKACDGDRVPRPCDASADVRKQQKFGGLREEESRRGYHLVYATRNGRAYVMWPKDLVSGQQIQNQLCAAGFDHAIKFDGSSGFECYGKIGSRPIHCKDHEFSQSVPRAPYFPFVLCVKD